MKLRLRYVIIFALGMMVMYALIAGNFITTPQSTRTTYMTNTGDDEILNEDSWFDGESLETNDLILDEQVPTTGSVITDTGTQNISGVNNSGTVLDEVVATIQGSGEEVSSQPEPTPPTPGTGPIQTKIQACAQSDGSYPNPLTVYRSETLSAKATGYLKYNGTLHYIVNVSNGAKFYYYYVCSTGQSVQARNITNTALSKAVVSNGQVILQ